MLLSSPLFGRTVASAPFFRCTSSATTKKVPGYYHITLPNGWMLGVDFCTIFKSEYATERLDKRSFNKTPNSIGVTLFVFKGCKGSIAPFQIKEIRTEINN